MALPEQIKVRISSEAAGAISMTPVVTQTIPFRDLVEIVLALTGKDVARVLEVLVRGAVVQGASRFRWEPLAAAAGDVAALLSSFPDPDPSRAFRPDHCLGARIRSGAHVIELPRQIAAQRRLLKRRSFWDELMALAERSKLEYVDYSYRLRADEYRLRLTPPGVQTIRTAAILLRYSALASSIRDGVFDSVEFLCGAGSQPAAGSWPATRSTI